MFTKAGENFAMKIYIYVTGNRSTPIVTYGRKANSFKEKENCKYFYNS